MENKKTKICYILPFYDENTDTHLFYNYELITLAALVEDIYLIIEKSPKLSLGQIKQKLGIADCYAQKLKFPPLRFLELLFKCFRLRSQGYTNFYVHYSYYGAVAAELALGKVFYWNRGMPWLFKRSWFEEKIFRFILQNTILVTGPELLAKEYQKRYGVSEYRILSNWVDITRFAPENSKFASDSQTKTQAFQDLAQGDGPSRAIPQQRDMRVLEKLGASSGSRVVLFVHHLSKRKGADLVPEIAKSFSNDVLFLVAGDGPERESLKNCGVSNVRILGKIPNSEIVKYFQSADVFLMPSREEGSPHVILEAMASGTPFVASDIGGVRELVPKALEEFLCKSEDVKCFQEKIKMLLDDKNLYEKTKAECVNYAKNFDIKRGVEEFINLFK